MTGRLNIIWRGPEQASLTMQNIVGPWCRERWEQGEAVEATYSLHKDAKSTRQRNYLHGVVLSAIAAQARPNGQGFPLAVWKEHARATFLGSRMVTVTNPITGKEHRRLERISTESLNVAEYSEYIERVSAWAADELGVTIPVQYDDWERRQIDMATGEIVEVVAG